MKATCALILLSSGLAVATPPTLEEGNQLVERLSAPSYLDRERATNELKQFSRTVFEHAALELKDGGNVVEGWNNIRAALIQSGKESILNALQDRAHSDGAESIKRFNDIQASWLDSARKAALTVGLDAPSDFEAGLMEKQIVSQLPPIPAPGAF